MNDLATGLAAPPYAMDEAEIAPPKKLVQREWQAQRADNAFLSKALPDGAYYTAIDVGRSKDEIEGWWRKQRGVKPGIPDWLIVYRGITLWIERKAGSSLSNTQKVTREYLTRNGHHWRLARSTEEVEQACREVGIPLRATLGQIRTRIAEQNERLPAKPKRGPGKRRQPKPKGGITSAQTIAGWR